MMIETAHSLVHPTIPIINLLYTQHRICSYYMPADRARVYIYTAENNNNTTYQSWYRVFINFDSGFNVKDI